jgi:hypothetical protein
MPKVLDPLLNIMPPPTKPFECGTWEDWIRSQTSAINLVGRLPIDYKLFINAYGSGSINDFLYIFNPFSKNPNLNLTHQIIHQLSELNRVKMHSGNKHCPYPLYFEPGGLLPWGRTRKYTTLYWLADSDNPDMWPIVVGGDSEAHKGEVYMNYDIWEEYPPYLADFLASLLTGKITSRLLTDGISLTDAVSHAIFTPATEPLPSWMEATWDHREY